jgi:hypothetical protein
MPCLNRRRAIFWIGLGLFWLGRQTRLPALDEFASSLFDLGQELTAEPGEERWKREENRTWRWYRREVWEGERWRSTGITTPVHKTTGESPSDSSGYLDESLVPEVIRSAESPDPVRRGREGLPPSTWIRSLNADELRIWLRTIDVPPVGVGGMTFWVHLTRDHGFDPQKIQGLTDAEQARLHSAAHFGY